MLHLDETKEIVVWDSKVCGIGGRSWCVVVVLSLSVLLFGLLKDSCGLDCSAFIDGFVEVSKCH